MPYNIKSLVWIEEKWRESGWRAETIFGLYKISPCPMLAPEYQKKLLLTGPGFYELDLFLPCDTIEECKQAATKHYEEILMNALEEANVVQS